MKKEILSPFMWYHCCDDRARHHQTKTNWNDQCKNWFARKSEINMYSSTQWMAAFHWTSLCFRFLFVLHSYHGAIEEIPCSYFPVHWGLLWTHILFKVAYIHIERWIEGHHEISLIFAVCLYLLFYIELNKLETKKEKVEKQIKKIITWLEISSVLKYVGNYIEIDT